MFSLAADSLFFVIQIISLAADSLFFVIQMISLAADSICFVIQMFTLATCPLEGGFIILVYQHTVSVLKFRTLATCQKGLGK